MSEQRWSNPLVAGFGTASADNPPVPAQEQIDAQQGTQRVYDNEPPVITGAPHGAKATPGDGVLPADTENEENPRSDGGQGEDEDEAEGVPTGNINAVLEWVGNDPARAQQALDAEQAKSRPRETLIADLTDIADNA